MPDSHHRGRPRDRYYDDDYYRDDYYEPEPERRPLKRSLSRKAMDKLEDTFAGLGLTGSNKQDHSSAPTHDRHHSPRRHRSHDRHSHHSPRRHRSHDRHHSAPRSHRSHDRARSHHSHKSYGTHGGHHGSSYGTHGSRHGSHKSTKSHHTRRTYSESPPRHRRSRRDSGYDRDRASSRRSRSRSRSRSESAWEGSLKRAANAAAVEAFRLRKEPGSWTGTKGSRIATAALSAAAIGAAADSRKPGDEKSKLGTIGGTIGGLMVNRVVNGPRKEM